MKPAPVFRSRCRQSARGRYGVGYYETDLDVLGWFDRTLTHSATHVRSSALCLLAEVDCTDREAWLRRAQADPVAEVVATAVLLEAVISATPTEATDLFESDFATELEPGDLRWEWEYDVVVAHGEVVLMGSRKVWTSAEDDALARLIALQKAYCGREGDIGLATAIIVGKTIVNQFTRSPRSIAEAARWLKEGRPPYRE